MTRKGMEIEDAPEIGALLEKRGSCPSIQEWIKGWSGT
jgi:hypothetical protein